jgi:hypothetical protein
LIPDFIVGGNKKNLRQQVFMDEMELKECNKNPYLQASSGIYFGKYGADFYYKTGS